MYCSVVLAAFFVIATATTSMACSTPLTTQQFVQLYCDADLVFRGFKVGGSSGLAMDEHGRQIQAARITFQAFISFKGSLPEPRVDVSHTWTEGDPCEPGAFPDAANDFLVFSKDGAVETCRHSFPWNCVPEGFMSSMPIHC